MKRKAATLTWLPEKTGRATLIRLLDCEWGSGKRDSLTSGSKSR
jgi:hypothetical protein